MSPEDKNYPLQPGHIDASQHLWGAFDHHEIEISAGHIVRFCQERGKGWAPFTYDDIEAHYQSFGNKQFWFNRLVGYRNNWIIAKDGLYHITHNFVTRCFKSSPILS